MSGSRPGPLRRTQPRTDPAPPTRWERIGDTTTTPYVETFTRLLDDGEDVDGEARLADALAPRGARVLDAGAGIGRGAAAQARRGHDVTAVEKDAALVGISRERFPEVPVVRADILDLSPDLLTAAGRPTAYDVVVLVGNVMVYLAEDTETRALRTLEGLLAPEGRVLVGFHPVQGPEHSREYPFALFAEHVRAAGLEVRLHLGGYDLSPPGEEYVVAVLGRLTPPRG